MSSETKKTVDPLSLFFERDLTAAAEAAELAPAFERDDAVVRVQAIFAAGLCPVVTGGRGVGKSAVIHEVVRRAVTDGSGSPLAGRRVLQLSIGRCASMLKQPNETVEKLWDLAQSMADRGDVILFFRDLHLALNLDLEELLVSLPLQLPQPMLAEGLTRPISSMFEFSPELRQQYHVVPLMEPGFQRTRRILFAWAGRQRDESGAPMFTDDALEVGLELTHRFLGRTLAPRRALEPLGQLTSTHAGPGPIDAPELIEGLCRSYALPRALVDPETPLDLEAVEQGLREKLLGQSEAVAAAVRMIGKVRAGLSDPRKAFGVFLFVGPTGVGKTYLVHLLSELLTNDRESIVRLNMADYRDEMAANDLFGSPSAMSHEQRVGLLRKRIAGPTFSILLLDEFEKAHPRVHDRFFQLIDEGCFINGAGETVSCRSLVIVATCNAGAELWRSQALGFNADTDRRQTLRRVEERLRSQFLFEFLNRFDEIVHFLPLSRSDVRSIARRELEALQERSGMRLQGHTLEMDEGVLDWLTVHGYDPNFGARFLRRTIERHVSSVVADLLLRESPAPGATISLTVRRNRIEARVPGTGTPPAAPAEVARLETGEEIALDTAEAVRRAATALLEQADGLRRELEERERDRSSLLEEINDPSFWERGDAARPALDRFRELDVTVRVERRLDREIGQLEALGATDGVSLGELRGALKNATHALGEWRERRAEEGAGSVWLVVSKHDPIRPTGDWVQQLAEMELRWCERLSLAARVVGYSLQGSELVRVAIEVEGPGAAFYLGMEDGIHRLHRHQESDLRARIDVLARGEGTDHEARTHPTRRREGLFGLALTASGSLEIDSLGQIQEMVAEDAETLAQLLSDVRTAWGDAAPEPPETARIYAGSDGVGARDPRTQQTVPRLKDAFAGHLERLLESWRRRTRGGTIQG